MSTEKKQAWLDSVQKCAAIGCFPLPDSDAIRDARVRLATAVGRRALANGGDYTTLIETAEAVDRAVDALVVAVAREVNDRLSPQVGCGSVSTQGLAI